MSSSPRARQIARECVAVRVRLVNRLVTGIYDAALRPHGLTAAGMNVLVAVAAAGPVSPTALSRRLLMDKSTLSRDLDRLKAAGWVEAAPDEADARRLRVRVTPAGAAALDTAYPAWAAAQRAAAAALGPAAGAVAEVADRVWAGLPAGDG